MHRVETLLPCPISLWSRETCFFSFSNESKESVCLIESLGAMNFLPVITFWNCRGRKDAKGRRPGSPGFDPRTLLLPPQFLKSLTGGQV